MSNIIKHQRAKDVVNGIVIESNKRADLYFSALIREQEERERIRLAKENAEKSALLGGVSEEFAPLIPEPSKKTPEELEAEAYEKAEAIIADANAKKSQIMNQAIKEAKIKEKNLREMASEAGYREGYAKAQAEFEAKFEELEAERAGLMAEYKAEIERLEPLFAGLVIDYVERLTGIVAGEYESVIYNMLVSAINNAESSKSYIIHVPKEQFAYVSAREDYIRELAGEHVDVEIIADNQLELNSCKIETESCVIDTGLDTRLATLVNSIRLLAGGKKWS